MLRRLFIPENRFNLTVKYLFCRGSSLRSNTKFRFNHAVVENKPNCLLIQKIYETNEENSKKNQDKKHKKSIRVPVSTLTFAFLVGSFTADCESNQTEPYASDKRK